MASEKIIKRRIKSAKNISQITFAMQIVAAQKMRTAQQKAISGRPYVNKIAEMVATFVKKIEPEMHPLLSKNTNGKRLIILITTNKGLCGGLNTNLFRFIVNNFSDKEFGQSLFVSIGKKGELYLARNSKNLIADFSKISPFTKNIPPLTTLITDGFIKGEYKEVFLAYNNFKSALVQEPTLKKILPILEFEAKTQSFVDADGKSSKILAEKKEFNFLIEPKIDVILDSLLFHYLENQIRDSLLEAEASEHSARMLAMKNATDNARELIQILTLDYNKARQEKITLEIADITTARLALQ